MSWHEEDISDIVGKRPSSPSDLPLYKVMRTDSKGSISLIVARNIRHDRIKFICCLVDLWKVGLKDVFGSHNDTKKHLKEGIARSSLPRERYVDTELKDCQKIVKRGLRIRNALGLRVPRGYDEFKYILGDMSEIEVKGSLYKCFKCGKRDLPPATVEKIKRVAKQDAAAGVAGTREETLIYYTCDKCEQPSSTRYQYRNER